MCEKMGTKDRNEMPNMTLAQIVQACGGIYFGNAEEQTKTITGVVIDSRKVEPGNLYVPFRGKQVDGHKFIPDVFEKGAACSLSEEKLENPKGPYILVESSELALKKIAAYYRQSFSNLTVVGITGSVGKTSTKEMISAVLSEKFHVHKTAGNFNNEIGLPLTVLGIREGHQVAVLEMGISDFHEMDRLSTVANPDYVVITNIGLCHLENLQTRDGILQAKTECFAHMTGKGAAILNGDDDKLCTKQMVNEKPAIFYGMGQEPKLDENGTPMASKTVYATDVENLGFEGSKATIHTPEGEFVATITIPGEHNIYNALAATAIGLALGMRLEEIQAGIAKAQTIAGRTNFVKFAGLTVIDDCYNANPVSMEAAIELLSHAKGRSIAVLGDMNELGENELALHYGVGEVLAKKNITALFSYGEKSKQYVKALKDTSASCEIHFFEDKQAMIEELISYVKEGDSVLVKASNSYKFPEIIQALRQEYDA